MQIEPGRSREREDPLQELIERSGNEFHAKVARYFMDKKWKVFVSPFYVDPNQNKTREIDLVVEKMWRSGDRYRGYTYIVVRLFVECKFVPEGKQTVFWFASKNTEEAKKLVRRELSFTSENDYIEKHHYLNEKFSDVAKLFATTGGRGLDRDPFFRAISQVLNATVSLRNHYFFEHEFRTQSIRTPDRLLVFPVVVCSSFEHVYRIDILSGSHSGTSNVGDRFQFEALYAYMQDDVPQSEHFLIDFVAFESLEDFEEEIEQDVRAAQTLLH